MALVSVWFGMGQTAQLGLVDFGLAWAEPPCLGWLTGRFGNQWVQVLKLNNANSFLFQNDVILIV